MPEHKKLRTYAALFFWGTLFSYVLAAPRMYSSALQGYADFSNFYGAGKIVQNGQGHRLYDLKLQTQVQSQFSQGARLRNRALFYMRPPFEAWLFLPLSYLSYARAYRVWVALSVLLVGVTVALLRWRIPEQPAIPWWIHYPVFFSFCPIAYGFATGQDHALILLLFALVMIHLYEGKDLRAGCFLGFALFKFQLVLPFVLILVLVLKRKPRTLAGFSMVAAVLLGAGVSVVGWEGMKDYPTYLWRLNHVPAAAAIYPSVMPSLRGLVQGWGKSMPSSLSLDLVTSLLSLGLLVWAAQQWKTTAPRRSKVYSAGIATVFLATLLAGYHAFGFDLSLLFPVVLGAASMGLHCLELDATTRRMLLMGAAALMFSPLYLLLLAGARLNLMAVGLLLLALGFARAIKIWRSWETIAVHAHSGAG